MVHAPQPAPRLLTPSDLLTGRVDEPQVMPSTGVDGTPEAKLPAPIATDVLERKADQPERHVTFSPSTDAPKPGASVIDIRAAHADSMVDRSRANADAHGGARGVATGHDGVAEWWSGPGARASTVGPATPNGHAATFDHRSATGAISGNRYDAAAHRSIGGNAAINPMGASASGTVTGDGQSVGASTFVNNGFAMVGVNGSFDLEDRVAWASRDGVALHTGAYLAGWKNFAGLGGSIAMSAGGVTASVGGYAAISADRSMIYLGKYGGELAELKDLHQVEIREDVEKTARITGGVSYNGFGIGGRLQMSKGKEVVYRTFMEDVEARDALNEAADPRNFFRNKAEALGLIAKSVPMPNLGRPETILVGDEMVVQTTGKIQGGILLGGMGSTLGVIGTMEGSFEMAVRRLDDKKIELSVCPKTIKGIGITANATLAHAFAAKSVALAMRQSFVFDLDTEDGRDAYRKAVHGILPSNLKDPGAVHENDDERLLAAMNLEALPSGVTRTFLEKAEVPMTIKGVGAGIHILPDGAGSGGIAYHEIASKQRHVITDGAVALTRNTEGMEHAHQRFRSGTERKAVYATVRRVTTFDGPGKYTRDFDRLLLRANFSDSKLVGDDINKKMVAPINNALGTTIDDFERAGHHQSRDVTLERILTIEDMDKLARAPVVDVARACSISGADTGRLTTLISDLAGEFNPWDRAQLIQEYISDQELEGFGALHQVLGGNKRSLNVRTSSDAYVTPIKQAQNLSLQFSHRIESWDTKATLNDRFSSVREAIEGVREALRDLEDDSFLLEFDPVGMEAQRGALLSARRTLRDLLKMDHLKPAARRKVIDKLDVRDLVQRCGLLVDKYEDPIQSSESKREVKDRFKEVEEAIREVSEELKKISKDSTLNRADVDVQRCRQDELKALKGQLEGLISFAHLSSEARGVLYERMLEHEVGCFSFLFSNRPSRTEARILGRLEAYGTAFDADRPIGPQPGLPTAHPRRRHNMHRGPQMGFVRR